MDFGTLARRYGFKISFQIFGSLNTLPFPVDCEDLHQDIGDISGSAGKITAGADHPHQETWEISSSVGTMATSTEYLHQEAWQMISACAVRVANTPLLPLSDLKFFWQAMIAQ